jgi:predicted HTH transcriptional regulator
MKFLIDLALSPKTVKQTFRKGLIEKLSFLWRRKFRKVTRMMQSSFDKPFLQKKRFVIVISEIEKTGVELNERQRDGLKIIYEKGKITNADYAKLFDISRNTATTDLSNLVEKGLIKRVGRGRGSYYAPGI